MNIKEWISSEKDYTTGVALYAAHPKAKINLVRLFQLKKSSYNEQKLYNELVKCKDIAGPTIIVSTSAETTTPTPPPTIKKPTYKQSRLSDYPQELHPVFIKQKNDFYTACSLKVQLNALAPEAEEAALKICLQIEDLFDGIEAAWKILDHYTETNTILEVKEHDFSALTPGQLILKRNSKRSSLTKAKRLVANYKAALLKPQTIAQKTRIEVKKEKQLTKISQLEIDVDQLTKLINTK